MPRNALAAGGVFEPDPTNPLAGSYTSADAMDWHRQNMREAWAAIQNPQTWQDAADQYRSGMLMGSTAPEMKGLGLDAAAMKVLRDMTPGFRAYHGSPHSFDQFSSDKIGTGEGNQAYGHGLYLADSEGVARSYRDALSDHPPPATPTEAAAQYLHAYGGDREAAIARMADHAQGGMGFPEPTMVNIRQGLALLKSGAPVEPAAQPGHMYEVNVATDPAHFLDWDTPLSEQHSAVQDLVAKTPYADQPHVKTGKDLYHEILGNVYRQNPGQNVPDAAAQAAQALRDAGIPGI